MKVLHTIPYFNKASGGPVTCTYNLVKGLNICNQQTYIITFQPEENDVLAKDKFIKYLPDDRFTPLWFSKELQRYLKKNGGEYDIIHVNTIWTWASHIPIRFAKHYNKPLIISPHGMLYPQALKVSAWKKKLILPLFLKNDLKNANCIHATSEEEAAHIRSFGIDVPIAVIPNCICLDEFPKQRLTPNSIRKFGFVGRLNPIKNIDLLMNAWNSLGEYSENAELVIIGDGEQTYADYLKIISKKNNLKNISFRGFLSGPELRNEINSLDYLILPSKSENFGMVVAEALASGVPAITSTGTPWSILNEINAGWWVNPNLNELADVITRAIDLNESERLQMGRRGYSFIKNTYGSSDIAQKMSLVYDWLINGNHCPEFVI